MIKEIFTVIEQTNKATRRTVELREGLHMSGLLPSEEDEKLHFRHLYVIDYNKQEQPKLLEERKTMGAHLEPLDEQINTLIMILQRLEDSSNHYDEDKQSQ